MQKDGIKIVTWACKQTTLSLVNNKCRSRLRQHHQYNANSSVFSQNRSSYCFQLKQQERYRHRLVFDCPVNCASFARNRVYSSGSSRRSAQSPVLTSEAPVLTITKSTLHCTSKQIIVAETRTCSSCSEKSRPLGARAATTAPGPSHAYEQTEVFGCTAPVHFVSW